MHTINENDFHFVRGGVRQGHLLPSQHGLVMPIEQHRGTKKDRVILMLHGFSATPAVFRVIIPGLTNYDALFCPRLAGHGTNLEDFARVKAKDWLTALERTCEQLIHDYAQVDVMGLSMGGLLACYLEQKYPLHHLYLLAPALYLKPKLDRLMHFIPWAKYLGMTSVQNRGGNLCTKHHSELTYRRTPLAAVMELYQLMQRFQLLPMKCPTDLFLGRHDRVVDNRRINEALVQQPEVRVHWLEHSAHVLPLDNDLGEILACVNEQ